MECPFTINVGVTKGGDMLIVKEIHNQHNHDMSKSSYDHLPRQRKLDTDTQKDVRNMLTLKANKKLVKYELTSSTGKVVTMKDIHNIGKSTYTMSSDSETLSALLDAMINVSG